MKAAQAAFSWWGKQPVSLVLLLFLLLNGVRCVLNLPGDHHDDRVVAIFYRMFSPGVRVAGAVCREFS
ncbi:hypothetical protein [Photorhabdus luminescens]|uniref:Uncharacterized protein n=1 Tax=Photorhabdus luminescens subsp. sonorensis TaxID=1173677 RepID=A0A5C4RDS7_PHOLU|nr:hypothetical protein [Photorhabdus luminescens]TNH42106.1 hypothetical protein EP164_18870 [Photorhabdus luminescens subsp. sonorensis]